jgi:acylglycerol lipase
MSEFAVLPADLEPTERGVLTGHGGSPLAWSRWEHAAPRGRIVICHGYGEHGERYRHTAHWLHSLGWSVSAMDHRGFGRSGGIRGDAEGMRAFVDDFALFLRYERRSDAVWSGAKPRVVDGVPMPPLPVHPQIVLAHSFGGLVALLTMLWHEDTMDALIASSPALTLRKMSFFLRMAEKVLGFLAPHRPIHLPGDKSQVCSDPVLVQRYWADPLCHRYATAAFLEAMEEGSEELRSLGHELDKSMLVLQAGDDSVADPDADEAFWNAVKPGLLERHRLAGFKHEVFHDIRRQEAQALVEPWLERVAQEWNPARNPASISAMNELEQP